VRTARALVLLCVLFGAGVIQAHAFNMTGTWGGQWTCRVQENGTFTIIANPSSVLKITHTGSTVFVDLDNGLYHYSGWAGTDNTNVDRGATMVVECRTNPASRVYNEMISAEVTAPSGTGRGKFDGISVILPMTSVPILEEFARTSSSALPQLILGWGLALPPDRGCFIAVP